MSLKNRNKIIYAITAIIIIVGCLSFWFLRVSAPTEDVSAIKTVQVGNAVIKVELAITEEQWTQGLSGRTSLGSSTGMFFVFNNSGYWSMWMKDMNFPIDVLWISDDLKVGDIVENMLPASYPNAYTSRAPARYVLEVPAGTVKQYGIAVGQNVTEK